MDVNNSGIYTAVSHKCLKSDQVGAILIMVSCESMPECMAGKTVFPSQFFFMGKNKSRDTLVVNGFLRIPFLGKKPVPWPLVRRKGIPVL